MLLGGSTVIDVDGLSFSYVNALTGERVDALDGVDLEAQPGTLTLVCGASGCGKSTLLNIVAGLDTNFEGSLQTGGKKIGYVFQEDRILPWLTVAQNIKSVKDEIYALKSDFEAHAKYATALQTYADKLAAQAELLNKNAKSLKARFERFSEL